MLCIVIPAAGASSRMRGRDKLLEDVGGQPCLRTIAERAAKVAGHVVVTLPTLDHPRKDVLDGLAVSCIGVEDATSGMSASLRAGIRAVQNDATALMVLPADMPALTAYDLAQLWAVFQASGAPIVQAATPSGAPGHPVIFSRKLFPNFELLTGDTGARSIVKAHEKQIIRVPLADDRAVLDLDTPEDWAAFRATQ